MAVALGGVDEGAVRLHHPFWPSRRAAAEQPDGWFVAVCLDRGKRVALAVQSERELGIADRVQPGRSRGAGRGGLEALDAIGRHERGGRARVLEEVPKELGRRVRVHHDRDRAAAKNTEEGGDEVGAVGQRHDRALLGPPIVGGEQVRVTG